MVHGLFTRDVGPESSSSFSGAGRMCDGRLCPPFGCDSRRSICLCIDDSSDRIALSIPRVSELCSESEGCGCARRLSEPRLQSSWPVGSLSRIGEIGRRTRSSLSSPRPVDRRRSKVSASDTPVMMVSSEDISKMFHLVDDVGSVALLRTEKKTAWYNAMGHKVCFVAYPSNTYPSARTQGSCMNTSW